MFGLDGFPTYHAAQQCDYLLIYIIDLFVVKLSIIFFREKGR